MLYYVGIVLDWISISLKRDTLATTHKMSPDGILQLFGKIPRYSRILLSEYTNVFNNIKKAILRHCCKMKYICIFPFVLLLLLASSMLLCVLPCYA